MEIKEYIPFLSDDGETETETETETVTFEVSPKFADSLRELRDRCEKEETLDVDDDLFVSFLSIAGENELERKLTDEPTETDEPNLPHYQ